MRRTTLLLAAPLAGGLLLLGSSAPVSQERRPNIVIIVADDLGYGDLGAHGGKDIPTPNLDGLAAGGIRFTDAYVTGPYCSPTRAGLLSGKYPQRFGHEFNPGPGASGLPLDQVTLADRLRAAGYRTALFGKWHLGNQAAYHPMSRGFDEFFGFLGGAHSYFEPMAGLGAVLEGRTPVAEMPYLTDALADRAVQFIQRNQTRPFLLYLAFNAVHTPMHATEQYLARFRHIADEQRRIYAAMLAAMDDGVGRTLDALRAARLEEHTLIFFFSDNGGPTMAGTTINASRNDPLRGSKRQTWEGGIRVPFFVRWKGRLPEGRTEARPIIQLDVYPTALAAAGVSVQSEWKLDGVNLLPFLTGARAGQPHDTLYWRFGEHLAIRAGDWKLVKSPEGPLRAAGPDSGAVTGIALFNLREDAGERHDLAARHPEKVQELSAAWRRWNNTLAAPLWGPGATPPSRVVPRR